MDKQRILLNILVGASLFALLVLSCDRRMFFLLVIYTALVFPIAYVIAIIHKRQNTHPTYYTWLARLWCVMMITSPLSVICAALYHGRVSGWAAGLLTAVNGTVMFVVFYGVLYAIGGRKFVSNMIKAANWSGKTRTPGSGDARASNT